MKNKKTRYCYHHFNCDRKEDCFNGEHCPFFKINPDCQTLTDGITDSYDFEGTFDDMWEGKE